LFKEIKEKLKIEPGIVILGLLSICAVIVGFDFSISGLIVQLIGVIWPVWQSIQAIETKENTDDDK